MNEKSYDRLVKLKTDKSLCLALRYIHIKGYEFDLKLTKDKRKLMYLLYLDINEEEYRKFSDDLDTLTL